MSRRTSQSDFERLMRKGGTQPSLRSRLRSRARRLRTSIRKPNNLADLVPILLVALFALALGVKAGIIAPGISLAMTKAMSAEVTTGSVTHVRDGDTVVVAGQPIRLAQLDCAERGTPAGDRATRRMQQLTTGERLTCHLSGRQSYDREVGICALQDGSDIGQIMLSEGLCGHWW